MVKIVGFTMTNSLFYYASFVFALFSLSERNRSNIEFSNLLRNTLNGISINFAVGSNPNFTSTLPDFWMRGVAAVNVTNFDYYDWVVVNIQQSSYYRVNYDTYLWNLLRVHLNFYDFTDIHVLNRAQIIDDSLNLAQANRLDYGIALGILNYLSRETDHIPWAAANRAMILLNRWLASTDVYENYQSFVRQIVAPLIDHLGFDIIPGEHRMDRFARTTTIHLACEAQLPSCLTRINEKFEQFLNGIEIAPDLQSSIFCEALRQGFLRTAFTDELRLSEKFRVLVVPQNHGVLGLRVMMELIRNNFDDLINVASGQVNTMLSSIAARVPSEEFFNEFDSLLIHLIELDRITEAAVNNFRTSARVNLNWQQVNLAEIRECLETNVDS